MRYRIYVTRALFIGDSAACARFSVKLVASSAPAELSPSPHQLLCSHLRADLLEQLLHLRLFLSLAELVLFFPALRAASRLQLCSILSWSPTSWLIYLWALFFSSRALSVLACSLDPFRHLFQSFGKHTFLSLVGLPVQYQ
ncbi:hypothetical protein F511_13548 [Dorcoceras hygrometricum]|uniref:Uncharacterized protein n=1 Tax=Dorcoceras hygrometricum TaxID=472368 RepID=A0A2Z7AQN9_9LAMI|nr:hypothetical protein F511_13548 [Dorcoceras hygrometricum]